MNEIEVEVINKSWQMNNGMYMQINQKTSLHLLLLLTQSSIKKKQKENDNLPSFLLIQIEIGEKTIENSQAEMRN